MGHSAALVSSSSNALSIVTAAVVAISAVSATYHDELFVGEVYGTITAPAVDVVVSQEKKCKGMGDSSWIRVREKPAEFAEFDFGPACLGDVLSGPADERLRIGKGAALICAP